MALVYLDRCRETTTTTGTGTLTLAGAVTGFQSFASVGNGNTCYACIEDGTNWEVFLGTWSTGGTLSRDTVLSSSNSNNAVSFAAGTKQVILIAPAYAVSKIEAIQSGQILSGAVQGYAGSIRNVASGTLHSFDFASGAIQSGHIASGAVFGRNALGSTGSIASGSIARLDLGNAAVGSGTMVSGAIHRYALSSGCLQSGHIADGAIASGNIASGVVGSPHLANGSVTSGHISSGSISRYHTQSGYATQHVAPFQSGGGYTCITEEIISGGRAVNISQSGRLRVAMAGVSGRMPACGYVADNVASGIQANVYAYGNFQQTSGMGHYPQLGEQLFVGRSGHIVSMSGGMQSGGFTSGCIMQPMGYATNSGGGVIATSPMAYKLASG